jgi:hypothetical protein
MLRLVCAVASIFATAAALAQPRPMLSGARCGSVRALLAARGALILGTGPDTFDRFVSDARSCEASEAAEPAIEQTADNPQCFVGFRCKARTGGPAEGGAGASE